MCCFVKNKKAPEGALSYALLSSFFNLFHLHNRIHLVLPYLQCLEQTYG